MAFLHFISFGLRHSQSFGCFSSLCFLSGLGLFSARLVSTQMTVAMRVNFCHFASAFEALHSRMEACHRLDSLLFPTPSLSPSLSPSISLSLSPSHSSSFHLRFLLHISSYGSHHEPLGHSLRSSACNSSERESSSPDKECRSIPKPGALCSWGARDISASILGKKPNQSAKNHAEFNQPGRVPHRQCHEAAL